MNIHKQCLFFSIFFHIVYRIMSVNKQTAHRQITQIVGTTQQYLYTQLTKYGTYLTQVQNQIHNTITIYFSQIMKQQSLYKNTISQLQHQIIQLKEDNSHLRNQFMNSVIIQEQLKKSRLRVLEENAEKQERMRILGEQVERIRGLMNKVSQLQERENIVDFDSEADSPIMMNKYDCLETIKEVSEHDLSMTMSLKSFKSQLLEDSSTFQTISDPLNVPNPQQQIQSHERLASDNYSVDNYQDALMILKSYNTNGRVMKMTKKPTFESERPCLNVDIDTQMTKKPQRKGNQTINKIKKMRKIEDLDVDSKIISKSNQQNIYFQTNQIEPTTSIIQSNISYFDQNHNSTIEEKAKSQSNIHSTKFVSRVRENLVDLEEPIKKVTQILNNINSAIAHPIKKELIKDQLKKISYVGGLQFIGNCNLHDEPAGFGKLLFNKDVVYQGQWRGGKFQGWGKFILISFTRQKQRAIIEVDGHFRQGMMEGSVVCTFSSGERFMGMIKGQNIQKQGTFVSEKGIMTGYWQTNKLIYLI